MPARAIGLAWAGVDPAERDLDVVDRGAGRDAPAPGRWRSALTLANLPAGTRGLCHARRRRSRHPQPHPLRDARSGGLLFRPAPARRLDPRPLQPADRPHAGRARHRALRRRRRPGALRRRRRRPRRWSPSIPASSRSAPTARRTSPCRCRTSTARVRLMAMAWTRGGRRPCREGRARPRSGRGDGEPAALPRARRPSRLALDLASVGETAGTVALSVALDRHRGQRRSGLRRAARSSSPPASASRSSCRSPASGSATT